VVPKGGRGSKRYMGLKCAFVQKLFKRGNKKSRNSWRYLGKPREMDHRFGRSNELCVCVVNNVHSHLFASQNLEAKSGFSKQED